MVRVVGFFLSLFFCGALFADDRFYEVPTYDGELKIMSFNTQNLFDAEHDMGKNDFEFLPLNSRWKKFCDPKERKKGGYLLSFNFAQTFALNNYTKACFETDWDEKKVDWKIEQIRKVLDLQGDYPDILVLSEVENPRVVGQLSRALDYDGFYMTESPDARGIDLAVLYKKLDLSFLDFEEAVVEDSNFPTRNASAIHFRLSRKFGGGILGIYPVHWPSLAGPTSERIKAAKTLRALVNKKKRSFSEDGKYFAVVTGDFNTHDTDDRPHPIESVILDSGWSPGFQDLYQVAKKSRHPYIGQMPRATYYYGVKDQWNMFDRILVTADLTDNRGLDVDVESFRIHAPMAISRENDSKERIPYRFNHKATNRRWMGYSDHYAVHVKISLKK